METVTPTTSKGAQTRENIILAAQQLFQQYGLHKVTMEDIAENNLATGTNQLQVGITRAWYDLSEAYQQIGLATETQAAENLRVSRSSYRAGLNSLSNLLDAQAAAQQAASQVVEARANFRVRLSNYKYLTNSSY